MCKTFETLSSSLCRSGGDGIWRCVFHQGQSGNFSYIQFSLCVSVITPLTVGNATILMHLLFHSSSDSYPQKRYQLSAAAAAGGVCFSGSLTDFGVWAVQGISCGTYWQQWIACIVGIILVAAGVSCEVKANVVVLAGEGVVLAVCRKIPIKFGYMKVIFDVTLVVLACVLSLAASGTIQGVREGTVAAAVFVGLTSKQIIRQWDKWKKETAISEK